MICAMKSRWRWGGAVLLSTMMSCGSKATTESSTPVAEPSSPPTTPPTGGPSGPAGPSNPSSEATSPCGDQPGTALLGVTYDITKSRFAFGGPPTKSEMNGFARWVGPRGALAIFPSGQVDATQNAGEFQKPDWSNDAAALSAHVRTYFVSLGVADCQIGRVQVLGGNQGMTIALARFLDEIPVVNSKANARMNVDDQSTSETLHWPALPSATISAAKSFRDQLADPLALATYRTKLPPDAQGDGQVVIHHTAVFTKPMRFDATWDVTDDRTMRSFDVNGTAVSSSVW